jgi:recombination protein RecR
MWALESTNVYSGQYHILGGTLSAINGVNPEDLLIGSLMNRIKANSVKEVDFSNECYNRRTNNSSLY